MKSVSNESVRIFVKYEVKTVFQCRGNIITVCSEYNFLFSTR